ncbi:rRNA pseudouridine synthase [Paenimyroides tangerinum]|uniref:rRNA pseudouridine synthase n=1 Tax=Paenimyroides tangerinum TaxID=2488728 RepID=A0A3P3W8Y7_9FLAO|nr:pseudouridine synthase [Paenimyroides tangerinum]RRJ91615.1 rRNA pseudouridine synthase [Paenimyroides tangerinum]
MNTGRGKSTRGGNDKKKPSGPPRKTASKKKTSEKKPFASKNVFSGSSPYKSDRKPFVKGNQETPEQPKKAVLKKVSDDIRLNKYIANSGVCSRRDADLYIQSGNVTVNGQVVTEMGHQVKPTDKVVFDGITLNPEKKVYVLLNKPKGFSTSEDDNVSSAYDLVRNASKYLLKPIGRMDKNTIGLLLYTNDNEMIQKFTNDAQRSSKLYQVSLDKNLKFEDLEKIQKGVYIKEHKVWVEDVNYVENEPKSEVGIKLKSSNVKIVRAVFESLGYNVLKQDRVMFAGLTKWGVTRGQYRFLTEQEVINLKNI